MVMVWPAHCGIIVIAARLLEKVFAAQKISPDDDYPHCPWAA